MDIDFKTASYRLHPARELARMMAQSRIHWSAQENAWLVMHHNDVTAAFADRRLRNARTDQIIRQIPQDRVGDFAQFTKYLPLNAQFLDGSDHGPVRAMMVKAFRPSVIAGIEPEIDAAIEMLLDRVPEGEFDYVTTIAQALPTIVIQKMLGVNGADRPLLFEFAQNFTAAVGAEAIDLAILGRLDRSFARINARLTELIAVRTAEPAADILSALIAACREDDRLTQDDILGCCHALIAAGAETTAHMLGLGLVYIADSADLRARVLQGEYEAMNVVNELLRYPGIVKGVTRLVGEDFEWHGQMLRRGDLVWLSPLAANIDPSVFPDPLTIDPDRNHQKVMTFGPGIHHCVGHLLSRRELVKFFRRAFDHFDITICDPDPPLIQSAALRGYGRLMVRFARRDADAELDMAQRARNLAEMAVAERVKFDAGFYSDIGFSGLDRCTQFARQFTTDGIWVGGDGKGEVTGEAAIANHLAEMPEEWGLAVGLHLLGAPRMTIDDGSVHAAWPMLCVMRAKNEQSPGFTLGGYRERYRREEGVMRIARSDAFPVLLPGAAPGTCQILIAQMETADE